MSIDTTTRLRLGLRRMRATWRQVRTDLAYATQFRRFQEFHAGLRDDRNAIYMFFTSGLLHWLHRALKFIPADVNVVLIGSDLTLEERDWVATCGRPFHHIDERVDDITVLEFIFRTTRHHFGWLHIDCFVLNPRLFDEMAAIGKDVVANCIWSHPMAGGVDTLHSAFVFLNYDVMRRLREEGIEVSPSTYNWEGSALGRTVTGRPLYSRIPTWRHAELLRRVLPDDPTGLPLYSQPGSYFQLLVLFQLVANALGYRLNHVRTLVRDGSGSAAHYSNEIIHVNGVATYRRCKEDERTTANLNYFMLLQADYAILSLMGGDMPPAYERLRDELARELQRLGVTEEQTRRNLSGFLLMRGISEERCAQILSAA